MQYIRVKHETYKLVYDLQFRNRFTFIVGNSATGKSRLAQSVLAWKENQNLGRRGAVSVESSLDVDVMDRYEKLFSFKNGILIVDEDYADILKKNVSTIMSSNTYYIVIFRELLNLPYGVYDIFNLSSKTVNGYTCNSLSLFYDMKDYSVNPECVITEDQSSGYKFFKSVLKPNCISSKGKTRVNKTVKSVVSLGKNDILIIADEVGFGFEFSKLVDLCSSDKMIGKNIYVWLPKSFEYVLLNSGMFMGIDEFLKDPYALWDLSKYNTVEQYITSVLNNEMKKKFGVSYSKGMNIIEYFEGYVLMIFKNNFSYFDKILK